MSKLAKVYAQLGKLLADSNATTGIDDDTLIDAVRRLIAGYGGDKPIPDIDVGGVVEWYKQSVKDAYAHVESLGDGWSHHVVLADMHYPLNHRHSIAMAKALQATGKFGRIILLGDNADTNDTASVALMEDDGLEVGDVLIVNGNHDPSADVAAAYRRLVGESAVYVNDTNLAYYYDATGEHIRFICLDAYTTGTTEAWVRECIDSMPVGWTSIIMCHYAAYRPSKNGVLFPTTAGATVNTAYLYNIQPYKVTGYSDKLALWINGHFHDDAYNDEMGLHQISYNTDSYKEGNAESGTESEQSLSILSINIDTHEIVSYRIGRCTDNFPPILRFNYTEAPEGWQLGYYGSGGNGWQKYNDSATLLPAIPVEGGSPAKVYTWDDRYVHGAWSVRYYTNGRQAKDVKYSKTPNEHFRNIGYANYTPAAGINCAVVSRSIASGTITQSDAEHFHVSTDVPLFPDWTDTSWALNTLISNNSHGAYEGGIATDKVVYCEPGQSITITVDDAVSNVIGYAYVYFYEGPAVGAFKTRTGKANVGAKSYTVTVPNDCYYFVASLENLADVADHVTVTIT